MSTLLDDAPYIPLRKRNARRRSRYVSMQGLLPGLIARICTALLRLLCLLRLLNGLLESLLLRIGRHHRVDTERQDAAAELSGDSADLRTETRIAEQTADRAAQWLTDLPQQIAEKPLWRELLLQRLLLCLLQRLLLRICSCDRIGAEWQDRAADAAGKLA